MKSCVCPCQSPFVVPEKWKHWKSRKSIYFWWFFSMQTVNTILFCPKWQTLVKTTDSHTPCYFFGSNFLCAKCKNTYFCRVRRRQKQTKECIKFYARMNLISVMRCHSHSRLASRPHSFAYTMRITHWCGFNYIFICALIRHKVNTVHNRSHVFFFLSLLICSLTLIRSDWLIDCTLHNDKEWVQHTINCVGAGNAMRDRAKRKQAAVEAKLKRMQ